MKHLLTPPPPLAKLAAVTAALVATVMAAPVWATSQNTQGQAKIWLEYKGPQVLDACDPGMPSTESAVNVEAWGGFFEPGSDYTAGWAQARLQFSPHDVIEYNVGGGVFVDGANLANGQAKVTFLKGDNIIRFRQKASSYAPMPVSERRVIRVSLLTSCSDCRGAPGGTAISSQRGVFTGAGRKVETECDGHDCCPTPPSNATGAYCTFVKNKEVDCRVRVQAPGAETYTWQYGCTVGGQPGRPWCNSVPNRISDPICDTTPNYGYGWTLPTSVSLSDNTAHYRVVNNPRAIFEVQYNGYGCD
ncbi:MAG: hypothetical protein OXE03_00125 [Gammaproteobacteria bacterium]|nr:hypothetical protein [Gammaproteobacteria bacterium]